MLKKARNFIIIFSCILIVFYGILTISSGLPRFIKDKSAIKISFDAKKVDLTVETGKYVFYFNDKLVSNFMERTSEVFKSLEKNFINKAN